MLEFSAVYGLPPHDLVALAAVPRQFSPLIPGSDRLDDTADGELDNIAILAPPATIERQCVLAHALRVLKPGAPLVVLAPNDKGGTRLARELSAFGCITQAGSKSHHRIVTTTRPDAPIGIDAAIAAGAPRRDETMALWTQPGIFSFNRIDPGSALLAAHLPELAGNGADFGCGLGVLALKVLASDRVTRLDLIDIDGRAIAMARRNIDDPRARFHWADTRTVDLQQYLDFVVMNPPFHDGGAEDRDLGKAFISRAGQVLRRGGSLWLVANRHLPYEATLGEHFSQVHPRADHAGFKILQAVK